MKFKAFFKPLILSTFALTSAYAFANHNMTDMPMQSMTTTANIVKATGMVTAIDKNTAKLILDHQAIPALNWPPMKMGFKVANTKILNQVKVGQKVIFNLDITNKAIPVITAITVI